MSDSRRKPLLHWGFCRRSNDRANLRHRHVLPSCQ